MCTQPLFVDSNKLASIHARFLYCLPIPIQYQTRNFVLQNYMEEEKWGSPTAAY
jgi:hypothetical protein